MFFEVVIQGTTPGVTDRESIHSIPAGMEYPFHSCQNEQQPFHSCWNEINQSIPKGMTIQFRLEWNAIPCKPIRNMHGGGAGGHISYGHAWNGIPFLPEWNGHSFRMEWSISFQQE
jgi:hypothetical protein